MALSAGFFGLEPARAQGGRTATQGFNRYPIKNGQTGAIGLGDPVKLINQVGGGLTTCSATTDKCLGVFMGCVFNNPLNGNQPRWQPNWPTATSTTDGSQPYALVSDDPFATYFIQANASISIGDIGMNFDVAVSIPNATTGRSTYSLAATSRTTASALLQLVDIKQDPNNAFGDATPIVEVRIVQNRNAYTSAF